MSGRLLAVAVTLLLAAGGCATDPVETERSPMLGARTDGAVPAAPPEQEARHAARRFLDRYVGPDGRVVRHDEGGDSVSEGQAYGMLVAVAVDDRELFDRIWTWTRDTLQRDDGLLAWRWADGAVVDWMPATDADVDAAHALSLAAQRFGDGSYALDAARLAEGVLEHAVVDGRFGPVAVAGPWAVEERWVNPSYGAPVAFAAIESVTGDPTWEALADASRRVASGTRAAGDLPPDWAVLTDEAIEPSGTPSGGRPRHGYDAARVAIRFAIDCDDAGPPIAAAMVDEYLTAAAGDSRPPAALTLDGQAIVEDEHPVMTVAFAAAAHAAGDRSGAGDLLDIADAQARDQVSYYGDAWVALGRYWLTTDELGGCAIG